MSPVAVGARIKAAWANLLVTAIQELQVDASLNLAEAARSTTQAISAGTWTTITMTDVTDPGNLHNGTVYTVPVTGVYCCVSKVRTVDGSAVNSVGQGVHTSNVDGPWIAWQDTPQGSSFKRLTIVNTRISAFTAGDQLRLYTYGDSAFSVQTASLVIYRLGSS